jgi:hypothetical protein
METARWIAEHWFDLLQTAGIVSGFAFTIHALHTESESRKINNMAAAANVVRPGPADFSR